MNEHQSKEVVDRLRRIETRVTKFLETQGFDTGVRRPEWNPAGEVHIPSVSCSIKDILDTIPVGWGGQHIAVYHQGEYVCTVVPHSL